MNIRRVKAISYKEFIHLFRDIRSLLVIIFVPVVLLVLFGYALKLDVENVSIAVIDYDNSPLSREYIANIKISPSFDINYYVDTYEDAERLMDTNKIKAFVVIPKDFNSDMVIENYAVIQAVVDASEISTASAIINYLNGITGMFNGVELKALQMKNGITSQFGYVSSVVRFWFNEDLESVNYLFPGLVAIIMAVVAGFLTSLTIAREWETGTMEQLIPTPLTEGEVIAGKLITYFIIGFIDIIIYVYMGEFLFQVELKGSAFLMLFFSLLFLLCMLSFGTFVSITMRGQLAASQVTTLSTMLPAFLLSGFVFDINNMPYVIQLITYAFPARYFVDILRGIYLKGIGLEYLIQNGLFLLFYATLMIVLCRAKFRLRA